MARVPVEQSALTDPRYAVLAKLAGWANRHEALGRMCLVWNACQEGETYHLSAPALDALLECKEAGELLRQSQLAQRIGAGRYYIKGTKGRIEWLAKKRAAARENGKQGGRPPKPITNQHRFPPETPLSLSLSPAPVEEENPLTPLAGGTAPSGRAVRVKTCSPEARTEADAYSRVSGWPSTERVARHAHKLLAQGLGPRLEQARKAAEYAWTTNQTDRQYRTRPHNWFGREQRWKEWEGKPVEPVSTRPAPFVNRMLTPEEKAQALAELRARGISV